MCIRELANGNLKIQVNLRKGDELRELEAAFNDMTERLRSNVRQDRQHLKDIQEAVQVIETMITKNTLGKAEKDKILEEVKFVQETSEKVVNYFQI
jgi:nitrogen fixation/metabolism regulation signal transduction histidine kinase